MLFSKGLKAIEGLNEENSKFKEYVFIQQIIKTLTINNKSDILGLSLVL